MEDNVKDSSTCFNYTEGFGCLYDSSSCIECPLYIKDTFKVGLKHDTGKTMWNLVPFSVISGISQVLTFGAKKYKPNSWQNVEPKRYFSAMMRHLEHLAGGEEKDEESGLHHAFHFCCNAVFLTWFLIKGNVKWLKEIFN